MGRDDDMDNTLDHIVPLKRDSERAVGAIDRAFASPGKEVLERPAAQQETVERLKSEKRAERQELLAKLLDSNAQVITSNGELKQALDDFKTWWASQRGGRAP
jgi:hypothetical protein